MTVRRAVGSGIDGLRLEGPTARQWTRPRLPTTVVARNRTAGSPQSTQTRFTPSRRTMMLNDRDGAGRCCEEYIVFRID